METTLNIHQFMTVATHLAFAASKIIKDVKESNNLNIQLKLKEGNQANDPVTEADFKSQTLIIKGLRKYWPTLNIVGEQDSQYKQHIEFDYQTLQNKIYSEDAFLQGKNGEKLQKTLDLSKVIVWVDPLDATLSYTQGYLDQVTTLIGVSYEGKSCLGLVGNPYIKQGTLDQPIYSYRPRVFAAHSSNPYCTIVDQKLSISYVKPRNHNKDNIRITTTRSKISEQAINTLSSIGKILSRKGGMGKKALQIIENRQDVLCYLGRGISAWDVSAPQALILSVSGKCSKSNAQCYLIPEGSLVCVDQQLYNVALNIIKNSQK